MGRRTEGNTDFWKTREGDAWFARNQEALVAYEQAGIDPIRNLIVPFLRSSDRVLEVGCSNGWRLRQLQAGSPALRPIGIDVSMSALRHGKQQGSNYLVRADATALPFQAGCIDCVILGFVCYAVGRRSLLQVLAEAERVVQEDGTVVVLDFLPDSPSENPYSHDSPQALSTLKCDIAEVLVSMGGYQRVAMCVTSDDGKPAPRGLPGSRRVAATVLQRHPLRPDDWAVTQP